MATHYQLLAGLLPYLEEFEDQQKGDSVAEFIAWLQNSPELSTLETVHPSTVVSSHAGTSVQIAHLLGLSYKYIKFYFKKGFKESLLQTTEDFAFLATLNHFGDMRKNELIQVNTSEFTSGMEVIRRLERNGLIESFLDTEDRRARRVQLTRKGLEVFHRALPMINDIGDFATASLSDAECKRLLELLSELNHFHNPIFHQAKNHSISEIVQEYAEE